LDRHTMVVFSSFQKDTKVLLFPIIPL
jgi:hypothetical protein